MYGLTEVPCGDYTEHSAHLLHEIRECPGCPQDLAEIIRMIGLLDEARKSLDPWGMDVTDFSEMFSLIVGPQMFNALVKHINLGLTQKASPEKVLGIPLAVGSGVPPGSWQFIIASGSIGES